MAKAKAVMDDIDFKLNDSFDKAMSKIKDPGINRTAEFDVGYPTGFLGLDYLNGTIVHVEKTGFGVPEGAEEFCYDSIGLMDGSANTFCGRPGCGKSTLATQVFGNILKRFPKATGYIDDIEGSLPAPRRVFLLDMSAEEIEARVKIRNTGITTENVYQRIRALHDLKMENRAYFEYDTGLYDTYGNRIKKLQPSLYMIDSFAMLLPNDVLEDDELGNNMTAGSIAKKNANLVKKMTQLAKEANIILITINHLQPKIKINPYEASAAQINGLGNDYLPGGQAALYLANNLFKVNDKTTLKAKEGLGIDGSVCYIKVIKSRTNQTLREIPLIFNKTKGKFDEVLSLFYLLKEEGRIMGAGAYLYLRDAPDVKFAQKDFKAVLSSNPELQKAFAKECNIILRSLLSHTKNKDQDDELVMDLNNMIMNFNYDAA